MKYITMELPIRSPTGAASYEVNLKVCVQFGRAVHKPTVIGADKLGFLRPSKPLDTSSTESAAPSSCFFLQELCGYRTQRARQSQKKKRDALGRGGGGLRYFIRVSNVMKQSSIFRYDSLRKGVSLNYLLHGVCTLFILYISRVDYYIQAQEQNIITDVRSHEKNIVIFY